MEIAGANCKEISTCCHLDYKLSSLSLLLLRKLLSSYHRQNQEMEAEMDNLKATELRLGLPGSGASDDDAQSVPSRLSKRSLDDHTHARK